MEHFIERCLTEAMNFAVLVVTAINNGTGALVWTLNYLRAL